MGEDWQESDGNVERLVEGIAGLCLDYAGVYGGRTERLVEGLTRL